MRRPIVVDLFAGAGGMSLGFEAAGFDIAVAVEIDPVHAALHHYNFPYSNTICADIKSVPSKLIEEAVIEYRDEEVDVIVGGPPCQGFSQIGKRQLDDPRNALVFEYLRVVKALRPKYFVFENVPGIVSGNHALFVEELVAEFEELGYSILQPYQVLNAAEYGVAQNRHRFILIGYRDDMLPVEYPRPVNRAEQTSQLTFLDVKDVLSAQQVIGNLSDIPVFIRNDEGVPANTLLYKNGTSAYSYYGSKEYSLCHRRRFANTSVWGHVGSKHMQKSIKRFRETEPGTTEKISRFFRLHPDLPSNTLRAGTPSSRGAYTAPRPIHYEHPRCISIREAARLHSYPDWFQFHRTIWHGFRQIGNSVAPIFAKSIALKIQQVLGNSQSLETLPIYDLEEQDPDLTQFDMTTAADYFEVRRDIIPPRKRMKKD